GVPKHLRGKIARTLAGKIAIAARVDAMSGEFIGDKLVTGLKARIADIKFRE
ncbi:MAG TPA: C/D box methylation guide ribonucleoprotein complex aNOP56 subunit, partial [Hadesarchaea archaeon]|nr:C/D box methylation guide ribonucleoprotein complex aNOP56 subunit [Hadesarchaea archaeon]